jgi:hypothetical protein
MIGKVNVSIGQGLEAKDTFLLGEHFQAVFRGAKRSPTVFLTSHRIAVIAGSAPVLINRHDY